MENVEILPGDIFIFPCWNTSLGIVCPWDKGRYSEEFRDVGEDTTGYLIFTDGWCDIPDEVDHEDHYEFFVRVSDSEIDMYKMVYPTVNWDDLEKLRSEVLK